MNTIYPLMPQPDVKVKDGIAHSRVVNAMVADDTPVRAGLNHLFDQMAEADANPSVRGHYIYVDTGGGLLTAGQEAYTSVKSLTKPVVVHTPMAASAGYMLAAAADYIMLSDPMSQVGSVGVMRSYPSWVVELYTKIFTDLYPESSNRKNESFRAIVEGDTANFLPALDELKELDAQFMALVKRERKARTNSIVTKDALSGAMFTGRKAIEQGLADSIGTRAQALQVLNKLTT